MRNVARIWRFASTPIRSDSGLLREKERVAETEGRLTVQADPELLREEGHRLVREDDETDEEYAARSVLFGALLTRAREG